MKATALFVPLALSTVLVACDLSTGPDPEPFPNNPPAPTGTWRPPPTTTTPARTVGQPTITAIEIPEWPPLGKEGKVSVSCSSPNGSGQLRATFAKGTFRTVSQSSCQGFFTGEELGEGFGRLVLRLEDTVGAGAERMVEGLLVDLGAPDLVIEGSVLRPDGVLALHVFDAWVLGSVELTIDGKASTHSFPQAYPSTLGEEYDQSRVTFPLAGVGLGKKNAIVIVRDAAGNSTTRTFPVQVDGTPPTISFSSPAAGASVTKHFDVGFSASDDLATAPSIELRVGGSYAGTFAGPTGKITVDATGYGSGPLDLELVAIDEAGNRSTALRTVNVN